MAHDYRHADPPPIPDGHVVPQPPPADPPQVGFTERAWAAVFVAVVALAVLIGVLLR